MREILLETLLKLIDRKGEDVDVFQPGGELYFILGNREIMTHKLTIDGLYEILGEIIHR